MKKRKDGRISKSFTYKGKRYFVYGRSKHELEEKAFKKRAELETKRENRENPTLAAYYERFLDMKRDSVKPSTYRTEKMILGYFLNVRTEDSGSFGDLRLKDITVDDVRSVQKKLSEDLYSSTVNKAMSQLSSVLQLAVYERILDFNPCSPVRGLKRTEESARDTIHRALTRDETGAFFERARNNFYYDVFRFAIATGMRSGEIGALYSSDIRNDMIFVERTVTRSDDGATIIGDSAKTESGRRHIPVNVLIREILEHQIEFNRSHYDDRIADERIFRSPLGGILNDAALNLEIRRICRQEQIKPFTMHAFRATFATRLIESGANPRTVQELLGHASYAITMDLYGHVMDDSLIDAMEKTENILRK